MNQLILLLGTSGAFACRRSRNRILLVAHFDSSVEGSSPKSYVKKSKLRLNLEKRIQVNNVLNYRNYYHLIFRSECHRMVKLFFGNLPDGGDVGNDDIRPLFEEFGVVTECEVIRNYGYVVGKPRKRNNVAYIKVCFSIHSFYKRCLLKKIGWYEK